MPENQLIENAKSMFLNDSGRKDVIDYLTQNGISDDEANTVATNAYLAIKDQRKELMEEKDQEIKNEMNKFLVIGILVIVGSIIAALATGRIWIGAIIAGIIMIIKGVRR